MRVSCQKGMGAEIASGHLRHESRLASCVRLEPSARCGRNGSFGTRVSFQSLLYSCFIVRTLCPGQTIPSSCDYFGTDLKMQSEFM
jgi:hypothetical protein